MEFLYRFQWYRLYRALKYIDIFGPDQVSCFIREMDAPDIFRETLKGWYAEVHTLLPNRYRALLEKMNKEGVVPLHIYRHHAAYAPLILFLRIVKPIAIEPVRLNGDDQLKFFWEEEETAVQEVPPELMKRTKELESDIFHVSSFVRETDMFERAFYASREQNGKE